MPQKLTRTREVSIIPVLSNHGPPGCVASQSLDNDFIYIEQLSYWAVAQVLDFYWLSFTLSQLLIGQISGGRKAGGVALEPISF